MMSYGAALDLLSILGPAVLAFVLACWGATQLSRGRWFVALDVPNERSLHDTPTPRTGGIAIIVAFVVAVLSICVTFGVSWEGVGISVAMLLVLIVSVVDDRRSVAFGWRLGVHAAAALVIAEGVSLQMLELPGWQWLMPGWFGHVVTILTVVWFINLYNFMDGIDGLAGGMGLIGFCALAVLAVQAGDMAFAATCLAISAGCGGFLVLNFPPARIFMGDAGSSVLGLLAAALSVKAHRDGLFTLWLALLVFSPFVVDATCTLFRRAIAGEKVWAAHRSHFYQRLVGLGWGHRRTALAGYALMVACAVSAVGLVNVGPTIQGVALSAWVMIYAMLMVTITSMERKLESS